MVSKYTCLRFLKLKKYNYRGEVKLAGEPYPDEHHTDIEGNERLVWIFPLKIV
jgi:hypothetical protein